MTRRPIQAIAVALGVLAAVACVPPTPAAPVPTGVGVQWVRDTGGTVDPDGRYLPSYDRYSVLDGVVAGPTPVGPVADAVSPWGFGFARLLPDGTAKFPYNGFAGEGISGTGVDGIITMAFPGGTCRISLFDNDYYAVFPSPDGTRAAVWVANTDADSSRVDVVSLEDGDECPLIVRYGLVRPFGAGSTVRAPIVWAADSSTIAFTVFTTDGVDLRTHELVRLAAAAGATPTTIIPASSTQLLVPLGWSVADRLLVETFTGGSLVLATLPAVGGSLRTISALDPGDYSEPLPSSVFGLVGFFAPGSTTIVYMDPSRVTNAAGETFPWLRIRRVADVAGAASAPLVTPKQALEFHQEATNPILGPPFDLVDVPNGEVLERFVR